MTRAEKKCLAFSVGLHSLLAVILIGSAAFETMPHQDNMTVLNMIPARLLDSAGSGGGNPNAAPPPPQMQPARPQPTPAQPVTQPKAAPPEPVKHVEQRQERAEAKPVERALPDTKAELPSPKPPRKEHEVKVDYTPYNAKKLERSKPKVDENSDSAAAAAASAAAARRDRAIRQALQLLQSGLEVKASQRTIVDVKGEGGEAFANYGDAVRSIYDSKWIAPDNVANKLAEAKVKIVVQSDGTILSAEIVDASGESAVDKSVERALRAVTSLPKFPEGTHDQQRTFLIRFNLEAKEGSG
jgi:TonB family protein